MTKFERKILNFPPVANFLYRSRRITLPGLDGLPLYDVLKFFLKQLRKIGFSERAASISFNIIMAMPGSLIFLFTLVPFLPNAIDFKNQLLAMLFDVLGNQNLYSLLSGVVEDFFQTQRSGLLWSSVVFIIFFSSNAMLGIMNTFDRSYFEVRSSKFMAKRLTALKLTSLMILLVISSILLMATQGQVKNLILQKLGWDFPIIRHTINYSRWIVIFALTYFTVAFIYRFGPAVKVKWSLKSPGAVIATTLMILVTWLFSIWVNNFANYNKIYGSIGAMIVLMNLVYFNSLILIIGFEINVSVAAIKAQAKQRMAGEDKLATQ
ncbi:MAG TPA: YihY/virulence factor BrkB family protein [Phnomibacter sp.]|nr:YihY/virulence factor BrkB family protein [Phnomibacter sp.]